MVYEIIESDNYIIKRFKREANIKLASLSNDNDEYDYYKKLYDYILKNIKQLYETKKYKDLVIDDIINTLNCIYNNKVLSNLTLNIDEFKIDSDGCFGVNNRCNFIYYKAGRIYNLLGYSMRVCRFYNHRQNKQMDEEPIELTDNSPIYISKGGIITGEYIKDCIIKQEIIDRHDFNPNNPIILNVSCIEETDKLIYFIDHRDRTRLLLNEFYEVPIFIDEEIKGKYNIRKYIKL